MALILIIDDATFLRSLVRRILQEQGHEVIEAINGKQGLVLIDSHKPDCILMDLLMPVLDGFGVLKILQLRGNNTPVIVLSADIQQQAQKRCLEFGAANFLPKPPQADQLRQAIQAALREPQKMAQ